MTSSNVQWIDTASDLARAAATLAEQPRIAFDTEFMRVSTLLPKLALLQIQSAEHTLLIDPLALDDLEPIAEAFADERAKVAHSVSEDLIALATRMPKPIGRLFDTQIAAAFTGYGYGIGYQTLVREALGVELPKDQTRSDWTRRPLGSQQIAYAAADVAHLPELHDLLGEKLVSAGRLTWFEEETRRMLAGSALRAPVPPEAHWKLPAAWRHPPEAQVRMQRLLVWREEMAWQQDKPRPWILDDASVLALAIAHAWTSDTVKQAVRGVRAFPASARESVAELLAEAASESERAALRPAPQPMDRATEKRLKALRATLATRAEELDLPAPLLASRRLIEAAVQGETVEELQGWRAQVIGDLLAAESDAVAANAGADVGACADAGADTNARTHAG